MGRMFLIFGGKECLSFMNNMKDNKLFSSKKFKYGSSAVIFTAVFVVFVLLFNVVLSLVDSKTGGLYIDMTSKKLYGISQQTRDVLSELEKPVEIIFCRPADIIEASEYANMVKLLAESYENEFDNVSVVYRDVFSDPGYFNRFKKTSADVIYDSSVIVHCPSTGLSKIYLLDNMYKQASSTGKLFAFDGENKITRAILQVARNEENMLRAGFVVGHNENIIDILKHFLEDYGFETSNVDLKKASSSELAAYNLLIVCDPQTDFSGRTVGAGSEVEKLRDYVNEGFGNVMFFLNATAVEMPELTALLNESFGVSVNNRALVTEGASRAFTGTNGLAFYGSFSKDTASDGYALHKNISEFSSAALPLFIQSCGLDIVGTTNNYMTVSPVVLTSSEAKLVEGDTASAWAEKPLMTLTKYTKIVDGADRSANVLVCGTTGFILGLEEPSYANADLLTNALANMEGTSTVYIDYKVLDESTLTVTQAVSDGMLKKLGIAVPVIIAVIGIAVFIKRKYL